MSYVNLHKGEKVKVKCCDCGKIFNVSYDTYRTTKNKPGKVWRCPDCMRVYRSKLVADREASLTPEKKADINKKRSKTMKKLAEEMTAEEKLRRKLKSAAVRSSKPQDEIDRLNQQISETLKKFYASESEEDRLKRSQAHRAPWSEKTEDEIDAINTKRAATMAAKSKKELEQATARRLAAIANRTDAEKRRTIEKRLATMEAHGQEFKQQIREKKQSTWSKKSPEEISQSITKRNETLSKLPESEVTRRRIERSEKWYATPLAEREARIKNLLLKSHDSNGLHQKFESHFHDSYISNDYYLRSEEWTRTDADGHHWDYGIYDKATNTLQMVVDLDGKYFHADECDYDGLHSKEEYDEKRSMSIPDGVKWIIIQEGRFSKCFKLMVQELMLNYDEFIHYIFQWCRAMPFPYPKYSDVELLTSYNRLRRMDCDDKYHQDISLNTRVGDRLINNFHESIWHGHRESEPSPYEAWYNDELLTDVIKNRVIYQNYLNPNKILQGFNISKIATKVSVFSAGRAKLLIHRYLSECAEIFDPFSGFSGRMLGAISLGKKYIGQDISETHVQETNMMIDFLKDHGVNLDVSVTQMDTLQSSGVYESLFTCPPYGDIEQWEDVIPDTRSCDDWILECLRRYRCRKYLFVVDKTVKFSKYIVDTIHNKSHFGRNSEYVVMICDERRA